MGIRSVIEKKFNEGTFTGEMKVYKTTESVIATPHWGEWECIREFVQNAMDEMTPEVEFPYQEVRKPVLGKDFGIENDVTGIYIWDKGRGVKLIEVLITGLSGKRIEMKPTRGEFGEGIKKAVSTLLRLGRPITIYTRNGYEIEPRIGIYKIENEYAKIIEYVVRKYNTTMDYGTIVYIGAIGTYSAKDFTTLAHKPVSRIRRTVYLVKPKCYEILPENIKLEMRGNEAQPYLGHREEIENICKEEGIKEPVIPAIVYDEVIDSPAKFIAYRDIILKRGLKSVYSYNIWKFVPVDVMGRDRQIISDKFLFETIGDMYIDTSRFISYGEKLGDKEKIRKMMKDLLKVALGAIAGIGIFEEHIYFTGMMTDREREYWRGILEEIGEKNLVMVLPGKYDEDTIEILKYNGYRVVTIPYNFNRLEDINPVGEIIDKLVNETEKYCIIDDKQLDDRKRSTLNVLRIIVNLVYRRNKDKLRNVFNDFKIYAENQLKKRVEFIDEPPKVFAFKYPKLTMIERGVKTCGHCDTEKRMIGIDADKLDNVYISLAVLNHELTHYVTRLTDVDQKLLREAIERIAGIIEEALIEEYNRIA